MARKSLKKKYARILEEIATEEGGKILRDAFKTDAERAQELATRKKHGFDDECPECDGKGFEDDEACTLCDGTGRVFIHPDGGIEPPQGPVR